MNWRSFAFSERQRDAEGWGQGWGGNGGKGWPHFRRQLETPDRLNHWKLLKIAKKIKLIRTGRSGGQPRSRKPASLNLSQRSFGPMLCEATTAHPLLRHSSLPSVSSLCDTLNDFRGVLMLGSPIGASEPPRCLVVFFAGRSPPLPCPSLAPILRDFFILFVILASLALCALLP